MPRVATCKDCGARFKVPDSTTATRAKCKTCGGVLEIPPADGAVAPKAAAKPAAGKGKSAPARKAAAAPKRAAAKPTAKSAPAKKAAPAKSGSAGASTRKAASRKAAPGKAAAGRSGGARQSSRKAAGGGRGKKSDSDSKTGMIVGIAAVVLIAAGAGWWFFGRDTEATTADTDTTAAADMTGDKAADTKDRGEKAPGPGAADDTTPAKAASPVAVDDTSSNDGDASTTAASNPPGAAAKAPAAGAEGASPQKAPAPAPVAAAVDPNAPLVAMSTLIEFDVLEPALGSTPEELAEWTALLKEMYVDFGGATGRTFKRLSGKARDLDPVLSVPAYINAINGVDISEPINIVAMYKMVNDWQKKVGHKPTFSFPADTTRMDIKVQNLRVAVLHGWRDWWVNVRMAGQDQEKLDGYRLMIEEALRAKDGG